MEIMKIVADIDDYADKILNIKKLTAELHAAFLVRDLDSAGQTAVNLATEVKMLQNTIRLLKEHPLWKDLG